MVALQWGEGCMRRFCDSVAILFYLIYEDKQLQLERKRDDEFNQNFG